MIEPKLSKEWILQRVSQEELFIRYLGVNPQLEIGFTNPLRADSNGDCFFYYNEKRELRFKDFAYGFNWSCVDVVMVTYHLMFNQALLKICADYNMLNINSVCLPNKIENKEKEIIKKTKIDLQIKVRDFEQIDIDYWGQFYLEKKDLISVYPTKCIWINSNKIYNHSDKDICYTYQFKNLKCYFPLREKRFRFIQQENEIQGLNLLKPDTHLIITKSYKDVLLLTKMGYTAISPASESDLIKKETIDKLKLRYSNIFIFLDNDKAGIFHSNKYLENYNLNEIRIPQNCPKDITDFVKLEGYNTGLDLMDYLITECKV
tara:strand:- start:895 stop:1848 length:954 start_codon:yes stop_codon:yes gene_type:complete